MTAEIRRAAILQYVRDYWHREGVAPTVREVAEGCGFKAFSSANYHIHALIAAGELAHRPGQPRTLKVVEQP